MSKFNMSLTKVPMPEQDPKVRAKNFLEVTLGYTPEQAVEEAGRCLQCKNPKCVGSCPVNINIPKFITEVALGDFEKAYETISKDTLFPSICGRVCPQENQCEGDCIRAIKGESVAIGRLERFVGDYIRDNNLKLSKNIESNGRKIAVIGSGPAGLACASELAQMGYEVTIFEALHKEGGVLTYGIPEFRLPKEIVKAEIQSVKDLGVHIERNVIVGNSVTVDELIEEGYEAVFIGSGAGLPKFMNIPGENFKGVYSANEFLTRVNLMKAYEKEGNTPIHTGDKVAVVGGGNVAMDAARTALRLGASEVYIVYRRGEAELPARLEEIHHAKEEGVIFKLLTNPTEIIGDDAHWVQGLRCVEMELGEPDNSGRRKPQVKANSEFVLDMDCVIMAIGQSPNPLIKNSTENLKTQSWGGIIVEEQTMATSKENVYAGGDVVSGAATVILAMGAGKTAAQAIHEKLNK